jgi:hypothetical protein
MQGEAAAASAQPSLTTAPDPAATPATGDATDAPSDTPDANATPPR